MLVMIIVALLLTAPFLSVAAFIVGLVRYLQARKQEKTDPGSVSPEVLKERKVFLVTVSVIFGVFLAIFLGIIALLTSPIAFM